MSLFNPPKMTLVHEDALLWMQRQEVKYKAIITSLPDMEECSMNQFDWAIWLQEACENIIKIMDDESVVFFYQTDRKFDGHLIDKKFLVCQPFYHNSFDIILSKIVLKQEPKSVNLFRPTYTNLFAFSKKIKSGKSTPDVFNAGKMIYKNAMGMNACELCIDFIKEKIGTDTVILDPFCGQGSVLKIAQKHGFETIGVEIDINQINKIRTNGGTEL